MASLVDLLDWIRGKERPIVLIHAAALREDDLEFASRLSDLPERPMLAVVGNEKTLDQAVNTARRLGLGRVFPADCQDFRDEWERWLAWMDSNGPGAGVAPHMEPQAPVKRYEVRTRGDKPEIIEEILTRLEPLRPEQAFQFEIRLILEETLNNALFHAFRTPDGREKYSVETLEAIAPGERISVELGLDSKTIAVAVSDNQGTLSRDTVLSKIERQLSIKGLLDQSGRGLYLTYSLSGRLIFNLKPARGTELVALFPLSESSWPERSKLRPVLIFEEK